MSDFRFTLDIIEVPIPCTVPWESMRGGEQARFCGQCRQHVYQLSSMSKEEAEALIHQKEGKLCVRFFRRPDGSVVTRDCAAVRWTRAAWYAISFVVVGGVSILVGPWVLLKYEEWGKRSRFQTTAGQPCFIELNGSAKAVSTPELAPPPHEVQTPAP